MNRQSISVTQIVILTLVVVTTVVLAAFGFSGYWRERDLRLKEIRSELKVTSGQLASSLALPMWNLDFEQAGKIIESVMQNRQVFGVMVREADQGKIISARARDGYWGIVAAAREIEVDGLLSDKAAILFDNKLVGTVEVLVTPRFMEESLRDFVTSIAAGILTLNICMVSILFFLLSRTVLRPLKSIEDYARKVGAGRGEEARIHDDGYFGELDNLRRSIVEMTRSLLAAQEELVRKEKLAILGQLSGSVGHELRNPLGVMSNAVYFLQMVLAEADETTKEYLEIIKHEIDNSERIITDLLDFARTKKPQTKAVTAHELVNNCIGRCAIPENVEFRTELPDTLPTVRIDALQVLQVLQNLVTNAVQAMPEGGALCIGARQVRGARNEEREKPLEPRTPNLDPVFVEISVADSGEGISPENMKKLFQPLFTTKAKGIGLGLVVCRNLTEANGGRLEVESRLGEGTTFALLLPAEGGGA